MTKTLFEMMSEARAAAHEVPPAEAAAALQSGDFGLVVDVREPAEYAELHVAGATCILRGVLELLPRGSLSAHLEVLREHPLTTRRYYRRLDY